jgi:hypothetical protein
MTTNVRPLTEEEKLAINHAITQNTAEDDRDPHNIIEEDYNGDGERYLRVMAGWHNVPIGIDRIFLNIKAITPEKMSHSEMLRVVVGLSKEEIGILLEKLLEQKKNTVKKLDNDIASVVNEARSDSSAAFMGDFYDNQIAVAQVSSNKDHSIIDEAIKILTEISKNVS